MRIVQLEGESLIAAVRRPAFAHEWVEYPGTLPGQVVERLRGAPVMATDLRASASLVLAGCASVQPRMAALLVK